uniref:Cytochrome P450 n=1 Tax=Timema tahoe TaxID=61484 RepID=A0A7R9NUR6_9NEOP|nr:unnamed protein product [Timema tahoe]
MGFILDSYLVDLLVIVATLFFFLYRYFTSTFDYFKVRGIPYLEPTPFFGNIKDLILMRISGAEQSQNLYRDLKQHRFGGVFHSRRPGLMVRDPELLKLFLQKDFNHFQDRGMMVADIKKNPIAAHLFNLEGATWRNLRVKLNPTFTPGRMKMMFQLLNECAKELQAVLKQPADDGQVLEMRDVFAQYTTDVIGTCVFGLQFNSMKDPDSEFRRMGKKVFQSSFKASLRRFLVVGLPGVAKLFNLKFASDDVSNFFLKYTQSVSEPQPPKSSASSDSTRSTPFVCAPTGAGISHEVLCDMTCSSVPHKDAKVLCDTTCSFVPHKDSRHEVLCDMTCSSVPHKDTRVLCDMTCSSLPHKDTRVLCVTTCSSVPHKDTKVLCDTTCSSVSHKDTRVLCDMTCSSVSHKDTRVLCDTTCSSVPQVVKETVEYREKNNVVRNDFMQLLIQLKNQGKLDPEDEDPPNGTRRMSSGVAGRGVPSTDTKEGNIDRPDGLLVLCPTDLTDKVLAAQAFVFFLAGFETSSTAMSFCMYELALNQDIQDQLRVEVDDALQAHGDVMTYEAVQDMHYLDRIISETLRKYPPAPNLYRKCTIPYPIPGTSITLEQGTRVLIPAYAIHHDPEFYPEPEKFDPERFTEENKGSRPSCTYLPFGEGPRICIGE